MPPPGMGAFASFGVSENAPTPCGVRGFPIVFKIVEHTENVNIDGKIY